MKISKVFRNPFCIFSVLAARGCFRWMPDKAYIQWMFRSQIGQWPDLKHPKTFNEKLQWLKLHDRRPEYTVMADKYLVREYIAGALGEAYLIPALGVWDDPEEIDFAKLPDQFVLKCNHNSGLGMYICRDKSKIDIQEVKKGLLRGLKQDYYLTGREWPYKNIPRKIVCEQYMTNNGEELADYKIHCFNGEPKMILVCRDRFKESGLTEDFFSEKWEHLPVKRPAHSNAAEPIEKPQQLEEMLMLAKKLANGIPFVRVDFYVIEGNIYFGELTFFPMSGFETFVPESWDSVFGQWISLKENKSTT